MNVSIDSQIASPQQMTFLIFKGCDLVIALTHMRQVNDTILAEKAIGIDIILGGHDHDFFLNTINGITVLKSGSDFQDFSVVTATFPRDGKPNFDVQRISVTSDYAEDPAVKTEVEKYTSMQPNVSRPFKFIHFLLFVPVK